MMLRNSFILVDYVGRGRANGSAVGHVVKTIHETARLLKDMARFELIVPYNYEEHFPAYKIKFFLRHFSVLAPRNLFKRFMSLWGRLSNLVCIFKNTGNEVLWFVSFDYFLFVFLFFYPKGKKRKIVVTVYREAFSGNAVFRRVKNYFFRKTVRKVGLVVKTAKKIAIPNRTIFCPDYQYIEERYKKYPGKEDENILCSGVMNSAKDLIKLVEVCSASRIKLKIAGFFPDKRLLETLRENANEKIEIQDRFLPQEEYYKNIAEARYCILPYKKDEYACRTSGVLLECVYLDTVVIAPHFLLEYNELPGIGYRHLDELEVLFERIDEKSIDQIKQKMSQVRREYSSQRTKARLEESLGGLLRLG